MTIDDKTLTLEIRIHLDKQGDPSVGLNPAGVEIQNIYCGFDSLYSKWNYKEIRELQFALEKGLMR
jgi:hypothetical protein